MESMAADLTTASSQPHHLRRMRPRLRRPHLRQAPQAHLRQATRPHLRQAAQPHLTSEPPACQNSNLATNNPTKWYDAAQVDVLLSRAMDLPPCERCPGQIPTPCERCPPLVAYHPPMETVESPHLGTTATVFGQGEGVGTWEWDIRRHKNIRYIMWRAHNPHLEPTCTPPASKHPPCHLPTHPLPPPATLSTATHSTIHCTGAINIVQVAQNR
jgi:hypothetical protein